MTKHVNQFQSDEDFARLRDLRARSFTLAVKNLLALCERGGWTATSSQISAAIPHATAEIDGWDILQALDTLRIPYELEEVSYAQITSSAKPCFVLRENQSYLVVKNAHCEEDLKAKGVPVFDPEKKPIPAGLVTLVTLATNEQMDQAPPERSLRAVIGDLLPFVWPLCLTSFVVNVLGLATPFFVMAVYNSAIPARSTDVLIALSVGLGLIYLGELAMRRVRSAAVLHIAARLEHHLGLALLHKLMAFPMSALLGSDAYQQRARLRQFEGIRDSLQGPLVQAILDLPFIAIFGFVIFKIAPTIGWIAVSFGLLNIIGFVIMSPIQRRCEAAATKAQTSHRKLLAETIENQMGIRKLAMIPVWEKRVDDSLTSMLDATYKSQKVKQNTGLVLQSIIVIAGISSGFFATRMAVAGDLSMGALIAILILVWRFLSPIQSLSAAGEQAISVISNLKMIETVLALPEETTRGVVASQLKIKAPSIQFEQVTMRFPDAPMPALWGVNFRLQTGQTLIVSGRSMSGKTCLAEMLAALHTTIGGRVIVNGRDIRQIPADDLREAIAFCQQEPEAFHGTIAQNLEFAAPVATEDMMWAALTEAGIARQVANMPKQLHTLLSRDVFTDMPHAFRQGIALAMTFIRPGPIFIFDQPTVGLDPEHCATIRTAIARRRKTGLVLLISNTEEDLQLGDRFLMLDRGRVIANEKGQRGREKIVTLLNASEVDL